MKAFRRLVVVLVAITAGIVPTAQAGAAPGAPRLTRVDTDAAGQPDPEGTAQMVGLSGDGRYALLSVRSNSTLVPQPHRTPTDEWTYMVRKDVRSGEIILASVQENGSPLGVSWSAGALGRDGTTFAYAGRYGEGPIVLYHRDLTSGVRPIVTMPEGWTPTNVALSTEGRWLSWVTANTQVAGDILIRHDLHTGQTTTLLDCGDPRNGCYIYTGPYVSDDGNTIALQYRQTPADPIRLSVLDAASGELRTLPEGEQGEGFMISGNGEWIFYGRGFGCPSCGGGRFELKRIATKPGASPELLRAWEDSVTWGVYPTSTNYTGNLVGYFRQTGVSGKYFAAARGYVHDLVTGIETLIPEPRTDVAYARSPSISSNSRVAVFGESCLWATSCTPTGLYAVALPELLPERMWSWR
ncbi:hypothetical protein [Saccharothrix deserti]|uniref:hypothetical protein n=1 Tax=Saccharothrix deserti TaxID=2593674 RepID=UPI00131B8C04|nr:hypothetical protein [Saccharothrix deserti]